MSAGPSPRVVVMPSGAKVTCQVSSVSAAWITAVRVLATGNFVERGANARTSSSIPSEAKTGSNPVPAPLAFWASNRCTAVSWAWRRAHIANGEGAGRNVGMSSVGDADSSDRTRLAFVSRYQSTRSPSSGQKTANSGQDSVCSEMSSGKSFDVRFATRAAAQRWISLRCRTRSRMFHPGQPSMSASSPPWRAASANT